MWNLETSQYGHSQERAVEGPSAAACTVGSVLKGCYRAGVLVRPVSDLRDDDQEDDIMVYD
jgi:hypothetical protein